ncbi:MAG TPA: hypothetical protein DGC76_02720, partial [Candidatus Accumulibacter sp.]|nr:hypothetical protein [Accumulibacter sp.]HCV12608.1 hypothetical protein [Accumulibacter sp.]
MAWAVLVPALAITGGSGPALASARAGRLVEGKKKRMRLIALNCLLIIPPSAFLLIRKAAGGEFDVLSS